MAEYAVHNVRFYDFHPQAIQCMSYEDETNRLALARADGNIEIWNCTNTPFMQLVLPGDKNSSVEALVWCQGRLFSAGHHGFLLEHNLMSREVTLRTPVTGGPTWCLALSKDKKKLAAGTEGGYVCIFNVVDDGVMYDRALEKQEGRILHIAWHSSGDYIVTGSVNCVRLWSLKEGRVTRCSLAAANKKHEVIVWCVGIFDDMTLVSGDSRGKLCFWNAEVGAITYSFQTHKADILTLAICHDQNSVYVAGVDPTIVQVKRVNVGGKNNKTKTWMKANQRSVHTHDVRALALTAADQLYSGGVDTKLTFSHYPPKTVNKFPALPPLGSISVAREAQSLLLQYKDHVELWQLGDSSEPLRDSGSFLKITRDRMKVLELQCKENEVIQWCAVSPKAQWIACIVQSVIRIYHFTPGEGQKGKPHVKRLRQVDEAIQKSHQVLWLTEGTLVSAAVSGDIQVIRASRKKVAVEKEFCSNNSCSVLQMTCSADGQTLALVDAKNRVTVFNFMTNSHAVLPCHTAPCTAIGVHPVTGVVVAAYADMSLREYNPSERRFTPFCRQFLEEPSNKLSSNQSVIQRVSFDPQRPDLILLHNDAAFIVVQKKRGTDAGTHERPSKKRKVKSQTSPRKGGAIRDVQFTNIARHNQVLYFSQVKDKAVVSVELNPLLVLDSLPAPLRIKKYGGT